MDEPLRLLLVGPVPPPSGGMANQTRQLRCLLEGEGVHVMLVQTNSPYRPAWVKSLRVVREGFRLLPYLQQLWRQSADADVVHVMANSGLAWHLLAAPAIGIAKRRGKPVVVNYRGGLAREFLARSASLVRSSLSGTRLVVPSEFLREVFGQYGVDAQIIPNVVDTTTFLPSATKLPGRDLSAPHVAIARNLEPIYGVDIGLRALASLRRDFPGLAVSIAGTGPERKSLEALSRDLGLADCVVFTGRLDVAGMVKLYQSADLVLNPVRADNTPNSVLEALACGVPVVSTNVGGVPYLVKDRVTAMLASPESPDALAVAMAQVLRDATLRNELIERGLAQVQAYAWPVVRDQWLQAYRTARDAG